MESNNYIYSEGQVVTYNDDDSQVPSAHCMLSLSCCHRYNYYFPDWIYILNDPNPSANVIGYQSLSSHQSKSQKPLPVTVGILIFIEVEVLDVAGPFEVFSVTRLNEERRWIEPSPFRVLLLAEKIDTIRAIGGLRLTPDVTLDNCPELDLLIVPGGWGTRKEIRNINLLNWITKRAASTKLTASVCTGTGLIGRAGLLDGREATTHWRTFDFLREAAPKAKIREDVRFTLVEPIFTSAGISAGIDLALRIVSYFFGTEIGMATAHHMEYPYPQHSRCRNNDT